MDDEEQALSVLADVRAERRTQVATGFKSCIWDDLVGHSEQGDAEMLGRPLSHYANRVLTRRDGADSTRADDKRMWEEEVSHPQVSTEPLGLGERFGHRGVRTLERPEIRTWLRETEQRPNRRGGTLSASAVRQRFYLLRRIIREAMDDDALEVDPTQGIRPPALPQGRAVTGLMRAEQDDRYLPQAEEVQHLTERMDSRTALAAALAFGAGMRAGEITALERRHLTQHAESRWTVRIEVSESQRGGRTRSATKTGPGGQGIRHLPEWVGVLIEGYLEEVDLQPRDRLLPSVGRRKAESISHSKINTDLTRACEKVGIPRLTLQDLRAAGEAEVARRIGRPDAAAWARHGLAVQMGHYVGVETDRASKTAAGWE